MFTKFWLQKTLSDMNLSKHKRREQDLEAQMRQTEKDLRKKIEDFSEKISKSAEEIKILTVNIINIFLFRNQ